MATKPTVRIPRWGRLGSQVEPNAGKEDTGFVVSERPPAGWVNWILNALGEWGWYFNAITDEHELNAIRVHGIVRTGSSPTIVFNGSGNISNPTILGTSVRVDVPTFASTDQMVIIVSGENESANITAEPVDTNTIQFGGYSVQAGTELQLQTTAYDIHFMIMGILA